MIRITVNRRFLLAKFQLDFILSNRDPRQRMQALKNVPRTMSAAYEDVLRRIEQSGSDDMTLVIIILSWLFYTKEPLSMEALREALVMEEEDHDLQRNYMLEPEEIVDCCKSLIIHETSSGFVRFTHFTVQDFIGTIKSRLCPMSYLAKICLNYLAMSVFDEPCNNWTLLDRTKQYAFSSHAGKYWDFYTSGDPEKSHDIQLSVFKALKSEHRRDALIQLSTSVGWASRHETMLHMIARAGLVSICGLILDDGTVEKVKYFA